MSKMLGLLGGAVAGLGANAQAVIARLIAVGATLRPLILPDRPDQSGFPSARLDPGKTCSNVMAFRFSTFQ
jgi:galactose mutarotase-like enzyme